MLLQGPAKLKIKPELQWHILWSSSPLREEVLDNRCQKVLPILNTSRSCGAYWRKWFFISFKDCKIFFSFSKTIEETISCGPPCVWAVVPRKAFTCFTNWQSKSCTSWILVIALSRVNSTGVRFFRRKLNVRNPLELINFSQNSLKFLRYLTTGETSLITRRTID